jgi:hypothetical protein
VGEGLHVLMLTVRLSPWLACELSRRATLFEQRPEDLVRIWITEKLSMLEPQSWSEAQELLRLLACKSGSPSSTRATAATVRAPIVKRVAKKRTG